MTPLTRNELIHQFSVVQINSEHDFGTPELKSKVLVTYLEDIDLASLEKNGQRPIQNYEQERISRWIQKIRDGKNPEHIAGYTYVRETKIHVQKGVILPPGQPTDAYLQAVEHALEITNEDVFIDIGTGTGFLPIVLDEDTFPERVIATDISEDALLLAKQNLRRHNRRAELVRADLLAPFDNQFGRVIACNPPYVPSAEVSSLPKSLIGHAPVQAVDGGKDGLQYFRELATSCESHSCVLALTFDSGQYEDVSSIFEEFTEQKVFTDSRGHPRAAVWSKSTDTY